MYYIRQGMGEKYKPLATFFAAATILVAYCGIGTFPQVNAIVDSAEISFGLSKVLTGFVLTVPGVPRSGCKVLVGGEEKGMLTSGTYSPIFKGIAVGYLATDVATGSEVDLEIHGRRVRAKVVKPPFYQNRV